MGTGDGAGAGGGGGGGASMRFQWGKNYGTHHTYFPMEKSIE
jgi:hypothetical protein